MTNTQPDESAGIVHQSVATYDAADDLIRRIAEALKDEYLSALEAGGGAPPKEIKVAFEAGADLAQEVALEWLASQTLAELPEPHAASSNEGGADR
jgi:hypothetical protein